MRSGLLFWILFSNNFFGGVKERRERKNNFSGTPLSLAGLPVCAGTRF